MYGRARPGSNRRADRFWCCPCLGPFFKDEAELAERWHRCHADDGGEPNAREKGAQLPSLLSLSGPASAK
jgi:hypothetical protein